MTYTETLDYLYRQLPMFQREGAPAFKKDLTNTLALCSMLGQPQEKFDSVHIAGTNGKGSVSHIMAAVLQQAGYKVGLYTSPHYKDFRERIKVNGAPCSEQYVIDFVNEHREQFEPIQPSFFELTVVMAFDHFAREQVDIAIIETGLGGRLDSTNVITPELSVITNIGWDHMQFLGDTLEQIAGEKAGIIKPEVPVVIGETQAETTAVFQQKASEQQAPLLFADQQYRFTLIERDLLQMRFTLYHDEEAVLYNATTDLTAPYQEKNMVTALAALFELTRQHWRIPKTAFLEGLADVRGITRFLGRWQVLQQEPLVICDSAHNPQGLQASLQALENTPYDQLHFVYGTVADKDLTRILPILPKNARYYLCKPNIPRGMNVDELQQQFKVFGLNSATYSSVNKAFIASKEQSNLSDIIFISGSIFVVAEVI